MLAVLVAVLCLVSVSHCAPLTCKDLIGPMHQPDVHRFQGRWALVAASLNNSRADEFLQARDSVAIDFNIVSFTQIQSLGDHCFHSSLNISIEGHILNVEERIWTITGILHHTSCPDCVVLSWETSSPFWSKELYLFSKRREVKQVEMEEFRAQVECLNMRPSIVMDPSKKLCPNSPSPEERAQLERLREMQSAFEANN